MNLSIPFRINIINEDGIVIKKIPIIREIKYSIDKRYEKGKIYMLYNETDTYIGSTIKTLNHRLSIHKNSKNTTNSKTITDNPPYKIELIENYPCRNRYELELREGVFQRNSKCINRNIMGRTDKEYRENNKDIIKEQNKEYYDKNKDRLAEYSKEYSERNKDKLKEYRSQKVQCDVCDTTISKVCLSRHKKGNSCKIKI